MPINLPGTLAACQTLLRPRLILPNLLVQDIRNLNFGALKNSGFKGVVLDKDNCLTLPHRDVLLSELHAAWHELKHEFGAQNLLVVSNSAGTRFDAGGLAAESVSHNLGVPVLRHSSLKPSRCTIDAIKSYFSSIPSPLSDPQQLIVVGDRVLTDIVLGNKLGAYSILVTRDWTRSFKSRVIRVTERAAIRSARRWSTPSQFTASNSEFIREGAQKDEVRLSYSGSTWTWTGRALGLGPNTGKCR